ncbi:MAG: MYXO-CTERM sorting domain-containing protein [Myxococcales bacterium]|nr:MYXO-CTERM sorting domain-containing protein [Myxococcales bacterium]
MIDAGARLVGELGRLYSIALNSTNVIGHRDHSGASTSCPGDHLHRRLDDIRAGGTPPGPVYGAAYVAQSFPLARDPFELAGGAEVEGYLEMRNTGTANWAPGETFLGTTEPRDVASPLAASDWISANRAATIDRVVAPGETGRFVFSVRAPNALGDYPQYFNLVQEGVAWFGDAGHRGPADNQIQIRVTVTSVTQEMPDAGTPTDAGVADAGTPPRPDGGVDVEGDAGVPPGGTVKSGCGCATTDGASGSFALALLALFALRRRR